IPARQKLPLRRSTEQEQSGARFGIFRALSRLDNLARLFSPFLAHAAREIDAQHHVQCVGCLEDSRVDDGENQRRAGQRPRRQRSERRATPQSEDPLDDEQNQYDDEQRRPEGNSRFRRLAAFLAFFTGSHRTQFHAWCDLRFRLVEEIDREPASPIGALETIKAGFGGIGKYKRTRDGLEVFFPARGSGDFYIAVGHGQANLERSPRPNALGGKFKLIRVEPLDGIVKQKTEGHSKWQVRWHEIEANEQVETF